MLSGLKINCNHCLYTQEAESRSGGFGAVWNPPNGWWYADRAVYQYELDVTLNKDSKNPWV